MALRSAPKKRKMGVPDSWRIGDILFNEIGPYANDQDIFPRFLEVCGYTKGGRVKVRSLHWKVVGPVAGSVPLYDAFFGESRVDWKSSTLCIGPDISGVCGFCQGQAVPGMKFDRLIRRRPSDNLPFINRVLSTKYCEFSFSLWASSQDVYQHQFPPRTMKKWVAESIAEGFALAGYFPVDLENLIIDFVV